MDKFYAYDQRYREPSLFHEGDFRENTPMYVYIEKPNLLSIKIFLAKSRGKFCIKLTNFKRTNWSVLLDKKFVKFFLSNHYLISLKLQTLI